MNYYKRHIGDYLKKTLKLTMLQDGAYNRLLDLYYSDEKPLPRDKEELYTSARCQSKADREAVAHVLSRYFTETDEGFSHNRCEQEIAASKPKTESNRVNGKLGGRPKKETEEEPKNNPMGFESETQKEPINNLSHKPVTNNQKTKSKEESKRAARLPPDWTLPDEWKAVALELRPEWKPHDALLVADNFRDHWLSAAGQKGVKLDWLATWRKWVRTDAHRGGAMNGAKPSEESPFDRAAREKMERDCPRIAAKPPRNAEPATFDMEDFRAIA